MKRFFFENSSINKTDAMSTFISRVTFLAIIALRWTLENRTNTATSNTMLLFFSLTTLIVSVVILQKETLQHSVPASTYYTQTVLMLGCVFSLFGKNADNSYGLIGILLGEVFVENYKLDKALIKVSCAVHSVLCLNLQNPELIIVLIHCGLPLAGKVMNPSKTSPRRDKRILSSPVISKRVLESSIISIVEEKEDEEDEHLVNRESRSNNRLTLQLQGQTSNPGSRINSGRELPYLMPPPVSESELGRAFDSHVESPETQNQSDNFSSIVCDLEQKDVVLSQTILNTKEGDNTFSPHKIKFELNESKMRPKLISESMFDTPKMMPKPSLSRWNSM